MQEDIARLKGQKPKEEALSLPPKNLPVEKATGAIHELPPQKPEEKPQIKIIEKPIIKWKEKIIEKIVKVPDQEQINALKIEYEKKVAEIKDYYEKNPKIVEKIVEKPVIKEKIIEKETPKSKKQTIVILIILLLLVLIGLTGYYLLNLEGEEITIETPPTEEPEKPIIVEPEPELKPRTESLVPTDGVHISLVEFENEPDINLPFYFASQEYNVLRFSDRKLGIVIDIQNNLTTLAEITIWEKTMPEDLANLFIEKAPNNSFRINNWEFPNLLIRYQNTENLENSLHYALIKDKLIITTSKTDMTLLLNNLWIRN